MSRKKIEIELNKEGVRELLRGEEMQEKLRELANGVQSRAGVGYAVKISVGKRRAYANVYAETNEAYRDNLENNTLANSLL